MYFGRVLEGDVREIDGETAMPLVELEQDVYQHVAPPAGAGELVEVRLARTAAP